MFTITTTEPLLKVGCSLGEGPIYDERTSTLHFVDIVQRKVYHLNTDTRQLEIEQFEESVTCLVLREEKPGLVCATSSGFATLENGELHHLAQPLSAELLRYVRFNDGASDSAGRFFAGTVCYNEGGVDIPGQLWRYKLEDSSCVIVDEGPFTDSNGLGWSPDGKTFYFTDSLKNIIYAYDYNEGDLSNRRVFVDALAQGAQEGSFADGFCLDDEGGLWSARWGGSRIIRYNKEGKPDAELVFPSVLRVTACTFGGPNNDQMYVTSAHCGAMGGDAAKQQEYPDSGHLFVVDLAGRFKGAAWRHRFPG